MENRLDAVKNEGALTVGSNNRWSLNGTELTCGNQIQVAIARSWIDVVIEHDGRHYYSGTPGVNLYRGMRARFPRE
jgi:hypothetical protein